jgi:transcriptional regulator with XRE-family HTH domain
MASAELSVVYSDDAARLSSPAGQALHRIQEVRRLQGMSLRTAARQLRTDIRTIRTQEQTTTDLKLSDLFKWQRALDVPVSELIEEGDEPPVAASPRACRDGQNYENGQVIIGGCGTWADSSHGRESC